MAQRERQLGRYVILQALGAGGMGEVYLAEDTQLRRKVAVKLLPAELTRDDEARRRLLREARSIAALDHPNVCTIYEVSEEGDRLFLAMQYIDGETLAFRLMRGRMKVDEAISVATQVAAALQEAHSRGIVHRDIKPANIMINSRGEVKVLDFGLAKMTSRDEQSATEVMISKTGAIAGTAPYMSPEQVRGTDVDGRTDIFSLGVVLYEVASGHRPFSRPSTVGTITAILFEDPPALTSAQYRPLEPVIYRCLEKDRDDRYPTAAELLNDLDLVRAGASPQPVQSRKGESVQPRKSSSNSDVEQLVLKGRIHWNKRHPEAVKQGILVFEEAVERDPGNARAYAGLADSYLMLAFLQVVPPVEMLVRIKAAAMRAIDLDPTLAEPHATLGYAAGLYEWDWPAAERELRTSIRLDPNYPWPPHWLGVLLAGRGRFDEAIAELRHAHELDPLSPIINVGVGIPYHLARRYTEALAIYHRVIETDPGFAPSHYYIGQTYEQLGDYRRAIDHFERCANLAGRTSFFFASLAHCHAVSGNASEAIRTINDLKAQTAHRYISPLNFALIEFGLGNIDAGLTHLEAAFAERSGQLFLLPVEPRFDVARSHPRFRELAETHGLEPSVST